MNIQTLEKQSMDTLQTLAETNVKVGQAKGILLELEAAKEEFLQGQEKEALNRIAKAFEESSEVLGQIQNNYDEIHQLLGTTSGFVDFLSEAQARFSSYVQSFQDYTQVWEEHAKKQEKDLADLRRKIQIDQRGVEKDKETLKKGFKKIEEEKNLIESRQAQIATALSVLEKKKNE